MRHVERWNPDGIRTRTARGGAPHRPRHRGASSRCCQNHRDRRVRARDVHCRLQIADTAQAPPEGGRCTGTRSPTKSDAPTESEPAGEGSLAVEGCKRPQIPKRPHSSPSPSRRQRAATEALQSARPGASLSCPTGEFGRRVAQFRFRWGVHSLRFRTLRLAVAYNSERYAVSLPSRS